MAQEAGLAGWTLAVVVGNTVMTDSAVKTWSVERRKTLEMISFLLKCSFIHVLLVYV